MELGLQEVADSEQQMGAGFEQGLQHVLVVLAGQQQPVEQLKENREELPLSSLHEHRSVGFSLFLCLLLAGLFALPSVCSMRSFTAPWRWVVFALHFAHGSFDPV